MIKQPKVYIEELGIVAEVTAINYSDKEVEVYNKRNAAFDDPSTGFEFYSFDEVIFMENTGFDDKNGNDIFVGDIVKRTSYDGLLFYKEEVKEDYFDGSYFTASRESLEKLNRFKNKRLEVIGNIYENKEFIRSVR